MTLLLTIGLRIPTTPGLSDMLCFCRLRRRNQLAASYHSGVASFALLGRNNPNPNPNSVGLPNQVPAHSTHDTPIPCLTQESLLVGWGEGAEAE